MMLTYKGDVDKLQKAGETEDCKNGEKKSENGGTPGRGGGADAAPSTTSDSATQAQGATGGGVPGSSEGVGGSEEGSSSSSTEVGETQGNGASPSAQAESTPTLAAVTVSTTSVICEGSSISSSKTTHAKWIEVSYVSCAASSEKASCMAVTGAMEPSRSETNGGSTDIVAACAGAASSTESGTSAGTICGGIAVYKSEESSSTDGTTAIVACATAAAEVSSISKDGGTSRLVIQECVGVAMRKTKGKGLYIVARQNMRIAFSAPKSTKVKK